MSLGAAEARGNATAVVMKDKTTRTYGRCAPPGVAVPSKPPNVHDRALSWPTGETLALSPGMLIGVVINASVASVLAVFAVLLLFAGRRRPSSRLLAVFLGLVALNFAAIAWWLTSSTGFDTRNGDLLRVSHLALALDPFYLLAFVLSYPYRRPSAVGALLLAVVGIVGLAGLARVLLAATPMDALPLLAGGLILGYVGAWIFALEGVLRAPTPLLAERSAWLLAAVGIAVLPRLGLTPQEMDHLLYWHLYADMGSRLGEQWFGNGYFGTALGEVLMISMVSFAFLALARLRIGRSANRDIAKRALRIVAWGVLAIATLGASLAFLEHILGSPTGFNLYALRWFPFAGFLVYGILRYEVVEFTADAASVMSTVGSIMGAISVFSASAIWLASQGLASTTTVTLAIALALGSAMPFAALTRTLASRIAEQASDGRFSPGARRLELYRAALESSYARGTPDHAARRTLDRDRRAFGVSLDEGRALEHVVAMRLARAPRPLDAGEEILPGVVIERELGRGAQGRALLARRVTSGERVVVKEAFPAGEDGLLSEALALRRLQHPSIVPLLDVHVKEGRAYLLSPFVEGETLAHRLARDALDPAAVQRIATQTLAALGSAHDAGVVHRDIKPSNLLVKPDGSVALIDFGVASIHENATLAGTIAGISGMDELVGTLQYMAPEQTRAEPVGRRADLYSLALVLAECLTGKPARDLRGASPGAAIQIVASGQLDLRDVAAPWRAFIERATAADPRERFADAPEMARALPTAPLPPGGGGVKAR